MKHYAYLVGEHVFSIDFSPQPAYLSTILKPYEPFAFHENSSSLFHMKVQFTSQLPMPSPNSLLKHFDESSPSIWVYQDKLSTFLGFSPHAASPSPLCILKHTPHQETNTLYLTHNSNLRDTAFCTHNALMLLYMLYTAPLNTLLIHSSVIRLHHKAYAFLGKSGTGKSTHSRLWMENIPNTNLLNDDNPIIHIYPEKIMIYGSPWSGKTPCYKNERAELCGIVRLKQSSENKIKQLIGAEAYAALLPSCALACWDDKVSQGIQHTITEIIKRCTIYQLQCLPNPEAAILCKSQIAN